MLNLLYRICSCLRLCLPESIDAWIGSPFVKTPVCTTIDEFIARLPELRGKDWYLSHGKKIRTKVEYMSPICVACFYFTGFSTHRVGTAGEYLGLSLDDTDTISRASEGRMGYNVELRQRIMEALDIKNISPV